MHITLPPLWTLVALALSGIALVVAFLNFRRKSSLKLRASYTWTSASVAADDQHISSVSVENLKDRAVTIFAIYLRVGHNYFIEIEDFEDSPLVLRAFETWHKEYGSIEFDGINARRISMNPLFDDKRAKKRIVLSTSDGKYVVTKTPKRWSPVRDFFSNHMTATIRPVRSTYKTMAIGGRVLYVVDVVPSNGEPEIIPIHPRDYEVKRFRNFRLTKESLATADALKQFLEEQLYAGTLVCRSFEVVDIASWRKRERDFYNGSPIKAHYAGYLAYKVLGRIATEISDRKLRKQNLLAQKRVNVQTSDT